MTTTAIKLNFRAPEKGAVKPKPVTYDLDLPVTQEELAGYAGAKFDAFVKDTIFNAVRDYVRALHEEGKEIAGDIFKQFLDTPPTQRTRGFSDELKVAALVSFTNWLTATGRKPSVILNVSKSFAGGFTLRCSPDFAAPLKRAVSSWYLSLSEDEQEIFEGLAAKHDEKLQSYIDTGLEIMEGLE